MFLTISTTGTAAAPASELGFLLHKHPEKAQRFSTAYGDAHVFYPEAGEQRCTAALLLDVDPVGLVRRGRGKGRGGSPDAALAQYVNDRPYAASSLLAVAIKGVFGTAMRGECKARPELPGRPLPLEIALPAVPAKGGAELVRALFEPLGWQVEAEPVQLDARFPEWGESRYVRLGLSGELRLADALQHLYVLLPVLDDAKHYWVAPDEVEKLLRSGADWLPAHPERELITRRYLARHWSLARAAQERLELARLADLDDSEAEELDNAVSAEEEAAVDAEGGEAEGGEGVQTGAVDAAEAAAAEARPEPLGVQRRRTIVEALHEFGAQRVLDLGCGPGQLIHDLLKDRRFTEIVGVDVSARALAIARRKLHLDRMSERQASRITLLQGALTYTDTRLKGYQAAVLSEVIEHVDEVRLPALEHAVFGSARPGTVLVSTPNAEYNVRWESLPAGHVRHKDHRFEWTRAQFQEWGRKVAEQYGYSVEFRPVGPVDEEVGAPTQLAVLCLGDGAGGAGGASGASGVSGTAEQEKSNHKDGETR